MLVPDGKPEGQGEGERGWGKMKFHLVSPTSPGSQALALIS